MKKIFNSILFVLLTTICNGQTWSWAKSGNVTGANFGEGYGVCTDPSGNVYITGLFNGPTITFGTNTLNNIGCQNIYLVKYDSNGNVIWAKSGIGTGCDHGLSVCSDPSGNIFLTGQAGSNLVFDTYTVSPGVFIFKFNNNGNALWAANSSGALNSAGSSIASDTNGNVYVTGSYSGSNIYFGTYTLTNLGGNNDMFIVKYNQNGNVLWAKSSTGTGGENGFSVSTDPAGNVFVGGSFGPSNVSFGTYSLTNSGLVDAFIVKYTSNGNEVWARNGIGAGNDQLRSLAADASGCICVTGTFESPTIVFGTCTLSNAGSQNVFIVKYDSNGNAMWGKCDTGPSPFGKGYSVFSHQGVFCITGAMSASMVINNFTITSPPNSVDPVFIIKIDSVGNVLYTAALQSGGDDEDGLCIDNNCNVYVTGDFAVDPFVVGTTSLTLYGAESAFLSKLSFSCPLTPDEVSHFQMTSYQVSIYPNPNTGTFSLKMDRDIKNGQLILINSFGQKVHEQKIIQGTNEIKSIGLPQGLYNYLLLLDNQTTGSGKLTIE